MNANIFVLALAATQAVPCAQPAPNVKSNSGPSPAQPTASAKSQAASQAGGVHITINTPPGWQVTVEVGGAAHTVKPGAEVAVGKAVTVAVKQGGPAGTTAGTWQARQPSNYNPRLVATQDWVPPRKVGKQVYPGYYQPGRHTAYWYPTYRAWGYVDYQGTFHRGAVHNGYFYDDRIPPGRPVLPQ